MKRILVIGGTANSLINFRGQLLADLQAHDWDVVAASAGDDEEAAQALARIGVRYEPLRLRRTGVNFVGEILSFIAMWRLVRRVCPDVVLAYTVKPIVYGLSAARWNRTPKRVALVTGLGYAFMPDGTLRQKIISSLVCHLYRYALKGCSVAVFQNHDDEALFRQWRLLPAAAHTLRVMGSGVDVDSFVPAPLPEQGRPVFLMVARLLADKGVREFVAAAKSLRIEFPMARCALLGPFDSNPSAIFPAEVEAWAREGVVEYWGETCNVRPYLALATVFVLPSYREGMPRSVLEAMAMGRPIITTDAPGSRDTVCKGENGFLVPVGDAVSLAAAMRRFLETPELAERMGAASRRLAEEMFDVRKVNAVMLEAIEQ